MQADATRSGTSDRALRSSIPGDPSLGGPGPDAGRPPRLWTRGEHGIEPSPRRYAHALTPSELARCREQNEVYRLALPVLEKLGAELASSRNVLALFDATGCMLSMCGDAQTATRLAAIHFSPGAAWPEDRPVPDVETPVGEGSDPEARPAGWRPRAEQAWLRSPAPIVAPGPGQPLGVVEIVGPWVAHAPQALMAARAIAHAVEERLRSVRLALDQVVEYAFRAAGVGEALFAVDRGGLLLRANDSARRRLSMPGGELPPPVRQALAACWHPQSAADGPLVLDWPGVAEKVTLLASPVRYDGRVAGTVVRVSGARASGGAHAQLAAVRYDFGQILGESQPILQAVALARIASRNDLPVVLLGESGVGKEMFAQAIHAASARAAGPFVAVNCGCIPASLLESELFGYEAGTFTGGRRQGNVGKFEEASGGTIFLDEVNGLSLGAQTALLRVLQEREVVRLGGSLPRPVDIRIIAATNESLAEEIQAGRFRADLFYRLHVFSIVVPPLRERRSDVHALANAILREAERQVGRTGLALSGPALRALEAHDWPGNVRELRNVVLRAAATARGEVIQADDLPAEVRRGAPQPAGGHPLAPAQADGVDRAALVRALEASAWNVARTAQALQVSRMTLYRWLHRHGIERHQC